MICKFRKKETKKIKKIKVFSSFLLPGCVYTLEGEWHRQRSLTISPSNSVIKLMAKRQRLRVLTKHNTT